MLKICFIKMSAFRKFWDSVYRISNVKACAHMSSVGGVTCKVDVTGLACEKII